MNKKRLYQVLLDYQQKAKTSKKRISGSWINTALKKYPKILKKLCEEFDTTRLKSSQIYDYIHPESRKTCLLCKKFVSLISFKEGYAKYCGNKCSNNSPEVQLKKKQTVRKNYGVDVPFQSEEIKKRFKQDMLRKYGVENPFQSEEIKKKIKRTCLKKYGVENPSLNADIHNKKINTCLKNRGCKFPTQDSAVLKKVYQTTQKKYGCNRPLQNVDIYYKRLKSSPHTKIVEHADTKFYLEGYEPQGLNFLLNVLKIPLYWIDEQVIQISYNDSYTATQKIYYPDFCLTRQICIEIKSLRVLADNERCVKEYNQMIDKFKGVRAANLDYMLILIDKNGLPIKLRFNNMTNLKNMKEIKEEINIDEIKRKIIKSIDPIYFI
jgi:hypothetical protein